MDDPDIRRLIDKYIEAYNDFDLTGMMTTIHPEIEFKNVSGGEVTTAVTGKQAFRSLAEQAQLLFSERKQMIRNIRIHANRVELSIDYRAVLATDLPNGLKSGETLELSGKSEIVIRDGKIAAITDIS